MCARLARAVELDAVERADGDGEGELDEVEGGEEEMAERYPADSHGDVVSLMDWITGSGWNSARKSTVLEGKCCLEVVEEVGVG